MKIGVLMKQVPDSETKIKVKADGSGIDSQDIKYIMNPYDEFAVEEALRLQTQVKGEVVVFTFGPKRAEDAMRSALAMGADRGVRVDDAGLEGADPLAVSRLLAAAAKAEGMQILFAGKQAIDDDAAQVPQLVAELLDWPHVTAVEQFKAEGETSATVGRNVGGGTQEILKVALPAVLSAEKGLNSPRYATLPNIMKAKKKTITVQTPAGLGVTELAPAVKNVRYSLPPVRSAGKVLKGEPQAIVADLVRLLHDEAKVI